MGSGGGLGGNEYDQLFRRITLAESLTLYSLNGWPLPDFNAVLRQILEGGLVELDLQSKTEAGIWAVPQLARGSASTLTKLDIRFRPLAM